MITLQPIGNLISKIDVQRDLLRVKCSNISFFIIGEIEGQALCKFQSRYRSQAKPFKPLPCGIEIVFDLNVLLQGEKG